MEKKPSKEVSDEILSRDVMGMFSEMPESEGLKRITGEKKTGVG